MAATAPRLTQSEGFRPIRNAAPTSTAGWIQFHVRMLADLQLLTIYRDLSRVLPTFTGAVLDVGCGDSPYRFLLRPDQTNYHGIDIVDAQDFDYHNPDVTRFDGRCIPFPTDSFDAILCTEVLEHVEDAPQLISEMLRVLRPGGRAIITIPWSARFHFIPHDYCRYTPTRLGHLFREFSNVRISPRGSDITSIANKVIVLWSRNLIPRRWFHWILLPFWVLALPVPLFVLFAAHVSLLLGLGSSDDPLGYTIQLNKPL